MNSIGILWAQYGPYHISRVTACKNLIGPGKVHAIELADQTSDYEWKRPAKEIDLITLFPGGVAEQLPFTEVFRRSRQLFAKLKLEACVLPSYAPKESLAALLAAKSLGIRTVMMNESHAGTARAQGLTAVIKGRLVRLFDSALVGGGPQKRYFASLGLSPEKIFTGYDAVDNDSFARPAEKVRQQPAEVQSRYDLPEHYILSLGRFVAKKNLKTLIRAYRMVLDANPKSTTHLVMVGSGPEESDLRNLCRELRLPIYDKAQSKNHGSKSTADRQPPGVHFYGFRQIDENPVFYALADAFVLPSSWEEWGLVVNEAMAAGLPVIVSETAGCAEDLLKSGRLESPLQFSEELRGRLAHLAGRIRQNGFICNPQSARSFANALLVLESSTGLRESMGQASRAIVRQFSCENFASNLLLAARAAMGDHLAAARTREQDGVAPVLAP